MKAHCTLVMAQLNCLVGDIEGNTEKILAAARQAKARFQADCVICPELAITGYPPEDLLMRQDFLERCDAALQVLSQELEDISMIVGHPVKTEQGLYNAASFIQPQQPIVTYYKQHLPNYGVFDEKRYFIKGRESAVIECAGLKIGLLICEDLWDPQPAAKLQALACDCVVVINASPYDIHKAKQRHLLLAQRARENACPYLYVHCVGGQDEFVFDGGSLAVNADGHIAVAAEYFQEELIPVNLSLNGDVTIEKQSTPLPELEPIKHTYAALVLACRDYVRKNGFEKVLLGSSGGIDSALTAAIAVDALGKDQVTAVFMPSRFTSDLSASCHQALVNGLEIAAQQIAIEQCYQACLETLTPFFDNKAEDITEQNIQARLRGLILMALSNKHNAMLLATGNKSEMAVGYSTLYGDMAGGFSVLKDVSKTLVYQLCEYRNQVSPVIPEAIIHRAPTAELAQNQADTDSLPEYHILDQILEHYVEHDRGVDAIVAHGFELAVVQQVIAMVNRTEYKRRQSAPGVRITARAFGRERRYPITSGFRP